MYKEACNSVIFKLTDGQTENNAATCITKESVYNDGIKPAWHLTYIIQFWSIKTNVPHDSSLTVLIMVPFLVLYW